MNKKTAHNNNDYSMGKRYTFATRIKQKKNQPNCRWAEVVRYTEQRHSSKYFHFIFITLAIFCVRARRKATHTNGFAARSLNFTTFNRYSMEQPSNFHIFLHAPSAIYLIG